MKCYSCGTKNDKNSKFCKNCGYQMFDDNEIVTPHYHRNKREVYCPKCGSSNIHFVTKQVGSDYDAGNACCGLILFGPLGLLCGLASDKRTETTRKCMVCEHEF